MKNIRPWFYLLYQFMTKKNDFKRTRQKYSVFAHEFDYVDYDSNTERVYNIDTDFYNIEIHNTDKNPIKAVSYHP